MFSVLFFFFFVDMIVKSFSSLSSSSSLNEGLTQTNKMFVAIDGDNSISKLKPPGPVI